jgi:hypothetical protein
MKQQKSFVVCMGKSFAPIAIEIIFGDSNTPFPGHVQTMKNSNV